MAGDVDLTLLTVTGCGPLRDAVRPAHYTASLALGAGRAPWRAGQALGYLCAEGGKAMFVAAADLSML